MEKLRDDPKAWINYLGPEMHPIEPLTWDDKIFFKYKHIIGIV